MTIPSINFELVSYAFWNRCIVFLLIGSITLLLLLNFIWKFKKSKLNTNINLLNFCVIFFCTVLSLIKFCFTLYGLKLKNILTDEELDELYVYNRFDNNIIFSTVLGDSLLALGFIAGTIGLYKLAFRGIDRNIINLSYFYIFFVSIIFMTYSRNLLVIYLSFEFIFIPTIYYVKKYCYIKESDYSIIVLFYWTLFGAFIVLCCLGYIFFKFKSLDYYILLEQHFNKTEKFFLVFFILIGFAVKVPLAPFHFWLIEIHVKAPVGFSIFLSGFLVKSAIFCLCIFLDVLNSHNLTKYIITWVFISLFYITMEIVDVIDFKKLIALATVQEMSLLLCFLLYRECFDITTTSLFILMHGLMSCYMFLIVDLVHRVFGHRTMTEMRGLRILLPKLTIYIWILLILFTGFPFTAKFYVEWHLISTIKMMKHWLTIVCIFILTSINNILVCKIFFIILYGKNNNEKKIHTESFKEEYLLLNFIIICFLFIIYLFIYISE